MSVNVGLFWSDWNK